MKPIIIESPYFRVKLVPEAGGVRVHFSEGKKMRFVTSFCG